MQRHTHSRRARQNAAATQARPALATCSPGCAMEQSRVPSEPSAAHAEPGTTFSTPHQRSSAAGATPGTLRTPVSVDSLATRSGEGLDSSSPKHIIRSLIAASPLPVMAVSFGAGVSPTVRNARPGPLPE